MWGDHLMELEGIVQPKHQAECTTRQQVPPGIGRLDGFRKYRVAEQVNSCRNHPDHDPDLGDEPGVKWKKRQAARIVQQQPDVDLLQVSDICDDRQKQERREEGKRNRLDGGRAKPIRAKTLAPLRVTDVCSCPKR